MERPIKGGNDRALIILLEHLDLAMPEAIFIVRIPRILKLA